jgi:hypothetical protein
MVNNRTEIVNAISNMDLELLQEALDEDKTYQDVSKTIFIKKLSEVFNQFKISNDSKLIPNSGFCTGTGCPNNGCKGISFVGNHSKYHLDLVVLGSANCVEDMFYCPSLDLDDKTIELGNDFFSIDILPDDLPGFNPPLEVAMQIGKCETACSEIAALGNQVLHLNQIDDWIVKYTDLFNSIDFKNNKYSIFNKFCRLFKSIKDLNDSILLMDEAKKSNLEFQSINKDDRNSLLKWLVDYEELYDKFIFFDLKPFDSHKIELSEEVLPNEEIPEFGLVQLYYECPFKIDREEFVSVIRFKNAFDRYYWDMLAEFNTSENLNINTDMYGNIDNENREVLSYHLKKIGMKEF